MLAVCVSARNRRVKNLRNNYRLNVALVFPTWLQIVKNTNKAGKDPDISLKISSDFILVTGLIVVTIMAANRPNVSSRISAFNAGKYPVVSCLQMLKVRVERWSLRFLTWKYVAQHLTWLREGT